MSNYIGINGTNVEIDATVEHYPMPRPPSRFGIVCRKAPPDLGVIHWTAGENPAPTVFATLDARGLSIHFVIDREGVIHQRVDPGIWLCTHAGGRANRRSVGIEVVNYGHAGRRAPMDPDRPTYEGTVHGWTTTMADFYPCQYDALDALCRLLSDHLPIDLTVPSGADERLSTKDLQEYSGWLGHYHVQLISMEHPKICPGSKVIDTLGKRWSKQYRKPVDPLADTDLPMSEPPDIWEPDPEPVEECVDTRSAWSSSPEDDD